MSVQFLAAWNGFEQYQVANLSGAEEARLISAGICRAYTVPASDTILKQDASGTIIGAGGPLAWQRTSPVACAVFGPSHGDLNPTFTDIRLLVGAFGSSLPGISPERWQVNTFYPQAYLVANGGVSGQTTADMLARANAAAGTTRKSFQDVLDTKPEVIFLASLSTNDWTGLTPANYRATVDATIARRRQLAQIGMTAGAYIVDEGDYPYSGTGHANPALTRQAIAEVNAVCAADALLYVGRMEYLPAAALLGDAFGNYLPNYSQNDANNGLHKSIVAENVLSQARAAVLTRRFGPSRAYRYAGTNLLKSAANGTFGNNSLIGRTSVGVGGGSYATGWTHGANGNLTQNLHSVQVIDGKRYSMMLGTSTAANAQQSVYFPIDVANFGFVAGDIIGMEFDMYVSDANDGPPPTLKTTTSRFNAYNPALLGWTHNQNASNLAARAFPGPFKQHVVFQPLQLPSLAGLTAVEYWTEWLTDELVQWKFGAANPRLVKIGSGGVLDADQR